ncbi:hypothetical protein ACFLR1_02015 [Bacteroidota bacterium]
MKRHFLLQTIALVFVALAINSCSSTKLSKLEGEWEYFNVDHLEDPRVYIWSFSPTGDFTVTRFTPTVDTEEVPMVIILGKYETKAEFSRAVVTFSNMATTAEDVDNLLSIAGHPRDYKASWSILEINDEFMRLGSSEVGGYVIREFTKVK